MRQQSIIDMLFQHTLESLNSETWKPSSCFLQYVIIVNFIHFLYHLQTIASDIYTRICNDLISYCTDWRRQLNPNRHITTIEDEIRHTDILLGFMMFNYILDLSRLSSISIGQCGYQGITGSRGVWYDRNYKGIQLTCIWYIHEYHILDRLDLTYRAGPTHSYLTCFPSVSQCSARFSS